MASVCFYFQVHQPDRLREYRVFDIGNSPFYLDQRKNEQIFRKVAIKSYLPMAKLLNKLVRSTKGQFKCAFSFSGVFLEQAKKYAPEVIQAYQELHATGCMEILSESYYHSLSFLHSIDEWKEQVQKHKELIKEIFDIEPTIFRNTELIYSDAIGEAACQMGFKAVLAEGVDNILNGRSPNQVFQHPQYSEMKILTRNYRLSDDIAFRFSNQNWNEWPLTTDKFASWIECEGESAQCINLFMDLETFGEHQWDQSGIFEFMRYLPQAILKSGRNDFKTPSEVIESFESKEVYECPNYSSWADRERDLSAWKSNKMQEEIFERLYSFEQPIKELNKPELLDIWRRLTTSDHLYYMSTKMDADGDVHGYFRPYDSPYDGYINMTNVLNDLAVRVKKQLQSKDKLSATVHSLTETVKKTS
jgi:alpha-amylase